MKFIKKFARNSKGATAIEYGLIAALISIAAITAMTNVGTSVKNVFTNAAGAMKPTA